MSSPERVPPTTLCLLAGGRLLRVPQQSVCVTQLKAEEELSEWDWKGVPDGGSSLCKGLVAGKSTPVHKTKRRQTRGAPRE